MTYITYEKTYYNDVNYGSGWISRYTKPPKKIPSVLPKPTFMPSYLVRTSDMKLIKGSEVHEGYCSLSYSWNQSGEILINKTTGKSYRIDEGKHKIILKACKRVRKERRERKRIAPKVKFVKFEELIQEICKDCNIKYIWYDQMCINQENEKEKHREIRQMHRIYSNAYCTVALIPELVEMHRHTVTHRKFMQYMKNSQWMGRMWTLEEATMSSKMLIVGRNTHYWGEEIASNSYFFFSKKFDYDISLILFQAHMRTSTKEHDHVYALGNLFPDLMEQITIDYNRDANELIIEFYGLLAKKDLNILFFGGYHHYYEICRRTFNSTIMPIQKFDLPSWTGVHGEHWDASSRKTSFKNYTVNGRILSITTHGLTNKQDRSEILNLQYIEDIIPSFPQQELDDESCRELVIRVRSPDFKEEKLISLRGYTREDLERRDYRDIMERIYELSHFWPIRNPDLQWIPSSSPFSTACFFFHDLTETLQDSAQYKLLPEVLFTSCEGSGMTNTCPVIKKNGDYYKAIGMCHMTDVDVHFCDDIILEEETFEIH
ncbi:hypothetical protein INT45_006870 [Circinella minor]|uniref:Heterokaryon incompatibility domain-containing protein n=1 Tax=Circinella minor TaxID=1195481 RepID=A0A8H7VHR2_9FUNG|nr:hypothetical protein INT45_006870 [Circinella minor]